MEVAPLQKQRGRRWSSAIRRQPLRVWRGVPGMLVFTPVSSESAVAAGEWLSLEVGLP